MASLAELAEGIAACRRCPLGHQRTRAVPGEGPAHPEVVLVGEAPGFNEDKQGRPFVGPAGQFLEELLQAAGLTRNQVFIANVIKCRPPANRDPAPEEISACDPWLQQQLAELQPQLVVTLGRFSMAKFFPGGSITRNHGQTTRHGSVTAFAMYHPAAALHNPSLRQTLLEDMRKIPALLERLRGEQPAPAQGPAGEPPNPKQLTLF